MFLSRIIIHLVLVGIDDDMINSMECKQIGMTNKKKEEEERTEKH